jgi:hypothetical protein
MSEPSGGEPKVREAGPVRAVRTVSRNIVTIQLSEDQRVALREITGEDIDELNIDVEELEDLGDLMLN